MPTFENYVHDTNVILKWGNMAPVIYFERLNNRNGKVVQLLQLFTAPHSLVRFSERGWSGGAMVLGKLPVPGRPTVWITVGQGPTALVVGAGGGCLEVFTLIYHFLFSFSLSLGDGPI